MQFIKNNLIIKCGLVFLLFFSLFLLRHLAIDNFYGTDAYYHTKHSWLIAQTNDIDLVEPWLEFHFLKFAPTDPWWGHHLILAAIIKLSTPVLGAKIFASLLAALVFSVFYFILIKFKVNYAFIWTWLFFSSSVAFLYRLFLARPLLLAMSFLPLAFYLMARKRYWPLFFLSLSYTLLYNLAPIIIIIAVLYLAVDYYYKKRINLKILISSCAGILAGILIHPQSLNYGYVIYIHLWQVLYLKFKGVYLGVGSEIHLNGFFPFLRSAFIVVVLFIIAFAILLAFKKLRQGKSKIVISSLCLISSSWLIVALFVPRAGDYWMPFTWLFIALTFNGLWQLKEYGQVTRFFREKINLKILKFFLLSVLSIIIINNYIYIFINLRELKDYNNTNIQLKQASDWLINNTEKNSIIFNNRWDIWPLMFYYNSHNHYIVGMDPTFLYDYNKELFWSWYNISHRGLYCNKEEECLKVSPAEKINLIKSTIKEKFRANYILIVNDPEHALVKVLNHKQDDYLLVFQNELFVIYKVI